MDNLAVDFTIENNEPLKLDYELTSSNIDCIFEIYAAGTVWGTIKGDLSNQADLQAVLDLKADKLTVETDIETLNNTVAGNYTTLDNKIDSVQTDLSGDISTLSNTVISNNTAVNNRINTTNTNLSNLQTTVNNNNTAINNRVDTTNTNLSNLQTTVSNNNTAINNRVDGIVDSFDSDIEGINGNIDTINENISNLSSTVDSKYETLSTEIQNETAARVNNDTLLQDNNKSLEKNLTAEISNRVAADNTLQNDINILTEAVGDNYTNLDDRITSLSNTVENNDTAINNKVDGINTTLTDSITSLSSTVSSNYTTLDNKINTTKTALDGDISDLSDTVNQNYTNLSNAVTNSTNTINNRIDSEISTLNTSISIEETARIDADSNLQSQIDAITGKEGSYYTKSEADNQFVPQTRTINNKALSENVTLNASDVNALPDTTVIGDGVLMLQKNGVNIDTFSANSTANKSINIEVPTALSELANDEGFITDADLTNLESSVNINTNNIATLTSRLDSVDLALNGKQNNLTSANAGAGISISEIDGVLKISNTQTSAQWGNISGTLSNQTDLQNALNSKYDASNPDGYITFSDLSTTLDNYQPLLVSGTNIKTINDISLLGEGNITINPSPDIDNSTITKNSSDELQAVGVIDENSTETLKAWKGTAAQFNSIETKSNNTLYYVVDAGQIYCGEKLVSNSYSQNVGAVVTSILPLTDAGLHQLDGGLIQGEGIYKEFVEYIAELYAEGTASNCFTIETLWQESVNKYGVCGKFVYDSSANTVRLPKVTGIIQGTSDLSALGNIVEAGLPNITGTIATGRQTLSKGAQEGTGAFSGSFPNGKSDSTYYGTATSNYVKYTLNASKSSSIYGKSSTVQPQTVKVFYYIVVATIAKTDIQVDIDEFAADLNEKADRDLSNSSPSSSFAATLNTAGIRTVVQTYRNGTSWYRVYSDGWIEQGGIYNGTITNGGNYSVSLLKNFSNTNYNIQVTGRQIAGKWGYSSVSNNSITTSSFQIMSAGNSSADGTTQTFWYACGY